MPKGSWGGVYDGGTIVDNSGIYYGDFGDDALRDPDIKAFYTGTGKFAPGADPRLVGVALVALVGLVVWNFR